MKIGRAVPVACRYLSATVQPVVVRDRDPLADIGNIRYIYRVISGGQHTTRRKFYRKKGIKPCVLPDARQSEGRGDPLLPVWRCHRQRLPVHSARRRQARRLRQLRNWNQ
jgi:hypothetical protein